MTTDISNLSGTITYKYHHHSKESANNWTNSATGGTYSDSSYESSSGGCFTQYVASSPKHTGGNGAYGPPYWDTYTCTGCGQSFTAYNPNDDDTQGRAKEMCQNHCNSCVVYRLTCGKHEGEIIGAEIIY